MGSSERMVEIEGCGYYQWEVRAESQVARVEMCVGQVERLTQLKLIELQ